MFVKPGGGWEGGGVGGTVRVRGRMWCVCVCVCVGYVTENVALVQDISALYRCLVEFETDLERASKMHKRRLDRLEPLLHELNPAHFLEPYITLHVACWVFVEPRVARYPSLV